MTALHKVWILLFVTVFAFPAFGRQLCTVTLSGSQEVPPNGSTNTGTADVFLAGRTLHFDISWTGLTGDFTGAHFHYAPAGETGAVIFDLGPFIDENSARGVWVLTNAELEQLEEEEIYVNVHSATYPGGEIRAQLDCGFDPRPGDHHRHGAEDTCVVELSGDQEVPPNDSPNSGTGSFSLSEESDTLYFDIEWTGVMGDFAGAHIHYAEAGEDGPIIFDLGPFIIGNSAVGWWAISEEVFHDLRHDELYVNVHSSTYPGGEIRAQLDCHFRGEDDDDDEDDEDTCVVELSGENEVPPNDSPYSGTGSFSLSEEDDTLYFNIEWSGLTGTFTGAHIHYAPEGEPGPVVFSLEPFINGNTAIGWWALSEDDLENLEEEELYVNVHSTTYPDGELRAQLDCEFEEDDDDGIGNPPDRRSTLDEGIGANVSVSEYALHDNYPNPFNSETQIRFDLVESGNVKLVVYDLLGREVATVVNHIMPAGSHSISFNAGNLPSGLYLYRLVVNGFSDQKKMLLMK